MTVGATWHCVVGRNFGSFVTHGKYKREKEREERLMFCIVESKHFIYFYHGQIAILLFKSA
jgi:dynein light chain LC8-type